MRDKNLRKSIHGTGSWTEKLAQIDSEIIPQSLPLMVPY